MSRSALAADVLVVGAGIAGLTAALYLQRIGVRVDVVELAPELRATGAGIMLHPNALSRVEELGLHDISRSGRFIERQVITDGDGSETTVDWRAVWADDRPPLAIHRQQLSRLLFAQLAPETVRWALKPSLVVQDADSVTVRFTNREVRQYALVIGADGINSSIRRQIDPDVVPRYFGQTYWRTTVRATQSFDPPEWRVWRAGHHAFGAMPIGERRLHVFLQASLDEPRRTVGRRARDQMLELAGTMGETVHEMVAALDFDAELDVHPAFGALASRWVRGRIGIVGDAVHAVSPATTQGGALAIEDAAVLSDEVARRGPCPAALTAFEARRQRRIQAFNRLSRLHVALMDSAYLGHSSSRRLAAPSRRDATGWFRRLYEPLMGSP